MIEVNKDNPFGAHRKILCNHYDRLTELMETGDTRPVSIEISLTDLCPLRCYFCISENFNKTYSLDKEVVKRFIKEYKEFGGKGITFSGGGEPTYHKDFKEIAEYAYSLGLDLGLMTSGVYNKSLTECIGKYFIWVRFSVDTLNEGTYQQIKGVNAVKQVKENIINLRKYDIKIGVNCNISKEITIKDVDDLILFCKRNNINYLQFRPILPRYFKKEKLNLNKSVIDYINNIKQTEDYNIIMSYDKFKNIDKDCFNYKACEAHRIIPVLHADGTLSVCMYHPYDDRFSFGNINKNTLENIWESDKRKEVIRFLREDLNMKEECQVQCKLEQCNKLLEYIMYNEDKEKNFI